MTTFKESKLVAMDRHNVIVALYFCTYSIKQPSRGSRTGGGSVRNPKKEVLFFLNLGPLGRVFTDLSHLEPSQILTYQYIYVNCRA